MEKVNKGIHPVEYLENYPGGLDDRMKVYENSVGTSLDRSYPAFVRVDGRAFKTYTSHFEKPFDRVLVDAFIATASALMSEIQGAKVAYGQSDEITVMFSAYDNPLSCLWFDGRVQKIASNVASIATDTFNQYMDCNYWPLNKQHIKRARFDAMCFNLPFVEVNNYFVWRQRDARRNSILSLGQHAMGQAGIDGMNTSEIVDALHERRVSWGDVDEIYKYGYSFMHGQDGYSTVNFASDKDYINSLIEKHITI